MENEVQSNIPPAQPLSEVPVLPKKNWLKILLFILIGLVVIAGSVFVGIQIGKRQIPTQTAANSTDLSVTPSPTINPTADWKTYTSSEFGFTFKYPNDWEVRDFGRVNTSDLLNLGLAPIAVQEDVLGGILITTKDVNSKISEIKNSPNKYSRVVSEKQITFLGYTTTEIIMENTLANVESKYLVFSKNQNTFDLSGGGTSDNLTIYQILSTFKFTN